MQKRWYVALAIALVTSLLVHDAQARPGGRRGGGRLGNGVQQQPGNGVQPSSTRSRGQFGQRLGNLATKLQSAASGGALDGLLKDLGTFSKDGLATTPGQLKTNFTADNRPFTAPWYAAHPNAWNYTHPHADAWAVATIGRATAWLGWGGSYYTSDTDGSTDDSTGDSTDGTQNEAEFLSLGVFGLAAPGTQDASALVQLAVNHQGELRGNYYDILTGQEQPITGSVSKQTQLASFKVAGSDGITFESSLVSLTQPSGTLTMRFNDGRSRQVVLSRLEEPATQPQ